jgi:hypothetical protein
MILKDKPEYRFTKPIFGKNGDTLPPQGIKTTPSDFCLQAANCSIQSTLACNDSKSVVGEGQAMVRNKNQSRPIQTLYLSCQSNYKRC